MAEQPLLAMQFRLMPRFGLAIGAAVLVAANVTAFFAAPEGDRLFATITVLLVSACLGSVFAHFLRLSCRLEVTLPHRVLRWSIGKERHQLPLDEIARVTLLLDETSDETAYRVVFELKNGNQVPLSDHSWAIRHAARLARRIGEFLERVPPGRPIHAAIVPDV
jgi:hypothetical protein